MATVQKKLAKLTRQAQVDRKVIDRFLGRQWFQPSPEWLAAASSRPPSATTVAHPAAPSTVDDNGTSASTPSSSTSTSSAAASTTPASSIPQPTLKQRPAFQPFLNTVTGRWAPPAISARRQAKLAAIAFQTGQLDALPAGPKVERLKTRIAKLAEFEQYDRVAREVRYAPPTPSAAKKRGERLEAIRTAKVEGYKGPYTGRKVAKMFKGSKVEKQMVRRRNDVKTKLRNMQSVVDEWQAAKAENKAKFRPGLPF